MVFPSRNLGDYIALSVAERVWDGWKEKKNLTLWSSPESRRRWSSCSRGWRRLCRTAGSCWICRRRRYPRSPPEGGTKTDRKMLDCFTSDDNEGTSQPHFSSSLSAASAVADGGCGGCENANSSAPDVFWRPAVSSKWGGSGALFFNSYICGSSHSFH